MQFVILLLVVFLGGCSPLECVKTFWGSSTRVLEEARGEAITKTYDKPYWECVRAVLDVSANHEWEVFKKDEVAGYVILMGIPGAVNTTEVGVFFVELSDNQTRIEIASLSTNAKRIVAKYLFHGVEASFGLVPFDPSIDKPLEKLKQDQQKDAAPSA